MLRKGGLGLQQTHLRGGRDTSQPVRVGILVFSGQFFPLFFFFFLECWGFSTIKVLKHRETTENQRHLYRVRSGVGIQCPRWQHLGAQEPH